MKLKNKTKLKIGLLLGVFIFGLIGISVKGATAGGQILLKDGNQTTPGIAFYNQNNNGIFRRTDNEVNISVNGSENTRFNNLGVAFWKSILGIYNNNAYIGMGASLDTFLYRDDANIFAQRNAANAQTLRIYGTYTDTDNYERLSLSSSIGSGFTIAAETAGTGGDNLNLSLTAAGTGDIIINTGDLLWNSDSTYNIGANGANRPNTIYAGGAIIANSGGYFGGAVRCAGTTQFYWNGRSEMFSPEDGGLEITNNSEDQDKIRIYGSAKTLTESSATGIFTADCTTGEYVGGQVIVDIFATDDTDFQIRHLEFGFGVVNKGGTLTTVLTGVTEGVAETEGSSTLTVTPTLTDETNKVQVNLNAESSLTQSTLECRWQVRLNGSGGSVTAL